MKTEIIVNYRYFWKEQKMKNNVSTFAKMKANGEKISMLTAYDYSTAKIMDNCVNGILVGDSLGNVMARL